MEMAATASWPRCFVRNWRDTALLNLIHPGFHRWNLGISSALPAMNTVQSLASDQSRTAAGFRGYWEAATDRDGCVVRLAQIGQRNRKVRRTSRQNSSCPSCTRIARSEGIRLCLPRPHPRTPKHEGNTCRGCCVSACPNDLSC